MKTCSASDLNPIEEAAGYRELMETFGLTQEQVSEREGKSRPVIANAMRLLGLPDAVRALVSQGSCRQDTRARCSVLKMRL